MPKIPRSLLSPLLLVAGLACSAATPAADLAATAVSPANRLAASPDLVVGPDGALYALWVDRGERAPAPANHAAHAGHGGPRSHNSSVDVMLAVSRDGGRTFGAPVRVNAKAGQVWSFPTARPKLAVAADGTLHVLYTGNDANAAGKPVIVPLYARSTDGGRSFEPTRRLASVPDLDMSAVIHGGFAQAQTFGTLLVDRTGGVHAYWLDTRFMAGGGDSAAVMSAHSSDGGRTFGTEQVVHRTGACPCCQLTAARGDGRVVFLGARHIEDGQRDSWVYRSEDDGRTFAHAARLGDMRWKIDGCPLKPTAVAVDGSRVYAAAFNGATEQTGVRFAASDDGGRTFGPFRPVHPEAAVSDAPSVAALPGGAVRVVWHAKAPGDPARAIYGVTSTDGGRTFGAVERLADGEGAGYPSVVALPRGDAALAWVAGDRIWYRALPAQRDSRQARR